MIRIIICGIAGRMGQEVLLCALDAKDMNIIGGIEVPGHPYIGKTLKNIPVSDDLVSILPEADCVIEFTDPQSTLSHLKSNATAKKAYVTGTTGFLDENRAEIHRIAQNFPLFFAPNMSIGVNHLYKMVNSSSKILTDYDIEVIETHHRKKKDAPSGTACAIVDAVTAQRPDCRVKYGREGMTGERSSQEIGVHAVRGGDVVGEHRIVFFGNGEFVELRHFATSRRCFAAGTLEAVRFIVQQKNGLYSMQDMLRE